MGPKAHGTIAQNKCKNEQTGLSFCVTSTKNENLYERIRPGRSFTKDASRFTRRFQYDDVEYGYTFAKQVEVSQETLKLTGNVYDRDVIRGSVGSKLVELAFTNKEVVLLSINDNV